MQGFNLKKGAGSLSSPSSPLLFLPFPFPFLEVGRLNPAMGLGEHCKLPQRVRAEPGRQTLSGAFSAYVDAFWQSFSSNWTLVKLQLLPSPQNIFHIWGVYDMPHGPKTRDSVIANNTNQLVVYVTERPGRHPADQKSAGSATWHTSPVAMSPPLHCFDAVA